MKTERFVKLPIDRALVWDGMSWFQRALGADMFRVFQERFHSVGVNWESAVCSALGVPGRERANVVRALRDLAKAGVLVVRQGTLRLLYSETSYREHMGLPRQGTGVFSDARRASLPRREILERDGWRCAYCGDDLRVSAAHIDHVFPYARGGSDEPSNLVAACAACNLSKGPRTPEEWLQ